MEYSFAKGGAACGHCEQPFLGGDPFFSVIFLAEDEPERRDFCPGCFEARSAEPDREFAFWKTRKVEAGGARRVVDFKALRELFFRMAEHQGGEYQKLSYLLGLVLIRKRTIRLKEFITENGVDYLVVTTRERPEPLRLEAPELRPDELADLRDRLRMLLDIDLEEENGVDPESLAQDRDSTAGEPVAESGEEEDGDS